MEIPDHNGFEIQELRLALNPVCILLSFPSRYSIAHVVGLLKSISTSEIFEKFLVVKNEL